jgi:hypothetical protein
MADQIVQRHGTQTLATLFFDPTAAISSRRRRMREDNGLMIDASQELSIERPVFRGIIV